MRRRSLLLNASWAAALVVLLCGTWPGWAGSGDPPLRAARVHVAAEGVAVDVDEVRLEIVELEPSGAQRSETVPLTEGVGQATISYPAEGKVILTARAEGAWSQPVYLPATTEPKGDVVASVLIRLWPAARLAGVVRAPPDAEPVTSLQVRLTPAPRADEAAPSQAPGAPELTCEVEEGRLATCEGPAGIWDLHVQVAGFAPEHIWGIALSQDEPADLGTLRLRRGGSIFGTVVTEAGPADPEKATVELRPLLARDPLDRAAQERLEQLSRTARLDERGQFQIVGVAPGSYELNVLQEGWSPSNVGPIEVEARTWTELDEVMLRRRLHLNLYVEPAEGAFGAPWTILLHRDTGTSVLEKAASGQTASDGAWRSPPLPAGPYLLQVLDGQEQSVLWRPVELAPGQETVSVDLPLLFVEGEVLLGDEPLPMADVWFGGMTGAEKVRTETDEEGEFLVVLPRDGEWAVDVEAEDPPVTSRGLEVEVEPLSGLRTADVVIEVPDTVVTGKVVDEAGLAPPTQPAITLVAYGGWRGAIHAEADPAGHFDVRGLQPGSYAVQASAAEMQSEIQLLNVAPDGEYDLQLTLRPERRLVGRIVDDAGPVTAAQVVAYPLSRSGRPARLSSARSRADGRFDLTVPSGVTEVRLLVLAPGHLLTMKRAVEGMALEIPISRGSGGTLVLERTRPDEGGASAEELLMIAGEPVDLPRLETWARMNGSAASTESGRAEDTLRIPAMPPGEYAYCRLSLDEVFLVIGGAALPASGACSSGYLSSGGQLILGPPG